METLIRESVKAAPVKTESNKWRVIVATPGKGSSGNYSVEVLKRDAAKMLPAGAQSFINHDDRRDPRDMIGVFESGGVWSEEDQAVVSELKVFPHWAEFVDTLAEHAGISLYALGDKDENDNITEFIEDAYNGADLVSRPGLAGSGFDQKLYEAARSASTEPGVETSAQEDRKDNTHMEIKDLAAKVDNLTTAIEALVSAQKAKVDEAAQIEADEKAGVKAVEAYDAAIAAIDEADLLPSQVTALRAEAKAGRDVAPLIESAKSVKAEMESDLETRLSESGVAGRVKGSEASTATYGAWK